MLTGFLTIILLKVRVLIMVLLILLVITGLFFIGLLTKNNKKKKGKINYDSAADAIVLSINTTESNATKEPGVEIQLQVLPETGRNFVAEISSGTNPANNLYPGKKVRVKYHSTHLNRMILINDHKDL
jgi:uncharacterized SAM-binding protein YcdF (DUF218 family)